MKRKLLVAMVAVCAVVAISAPVSVKIAEHVPPDPWTISKKNAEFIPPSPWSISEIK